MNNRLLSVCIPTYNRAAFLNECLESISSQFSNQLVRESINVFVLDNKSEDNTESVVQKFTSRFDNIKYIKDSRKRDMIRGIIKAASYGDGEYIWVFSDDDLLEENSLLKIIDFIKKEKTDLILCNVTGFSDDYRKSNLLQITSDKVNRNKRDFFKVMEKKFPISVDYYTTLCSNWIIKKDILINNHDIFNKFNEKLDMFPFPSLYFYSGIEFTSGIISQIIVLNRGDNESWGSKKILTHFLYKKKLWKDYYRKIIKFNHSEISDNFKKNNRKKNIYYYIEFSKQIAILVLKKIGIYKKIKSLLKN